MGKIDVDSLLGRLIVVVIPVILGIMGIIAPLMRLNTNVAVLTTKVEQLQEEVKNYNTQTNALQKNITENNEKIKNLTYRVDKIEKERCNLK